MNQTKLESLLEASVNIGIGFFLSLAFWTFFIAPMYHIPINQGQNLQIVGWFTVLSIARSYTMRRFFNAGLHKAIKRFACSLSS